MSSTAVPLTHNLHSHMHTRIAEVRQNIYKHSVGSWRRYAQQLQPMIDELNKYLPKLRKNKALPFASTMNWKLDPNFDYDAMLLQSSSGGSSNTNSSNSSGSGNGGKVKPAVTTSAAAAGGGGKKSGRSSKGSDKTKDAEL